MWSATWGRLIAWAFEAFATPLGGAAALVLAGAASASAAGLLGDRAVHRFGWVRVGRGGAKARVPTWTEPSFCDLCARPLPWPSRLPLVGACYGCRCGSHGGFGLVAAEWCTVAVLLAAWGTGAGAPTLAVLWCAALLLAAASAADRASFQVPLTLSLSFLWLGLAASPFAPDPGQRLTGALTVFLAPCALALWPRVRGWFVAGDAPRLDSFGGADWIAWTALGAWFGAGGAVLVLALGALLFARGPRAASVGGALFPALSLAAAVGAVCAMWFPAGWGRLALSAW